jgi:hypothetical protein
VALFPEHREEYRAGPLLERERERERGVPRGRESESADRSEREREGRRLRERGARWRGRGTGEEGAGRDRRGFERLWESVTLSAAYIYEPGEDRCGFLFGLGTGLLFVEAGFTVCPPSEMIFFWRRLL